MANLIQIIEGEKSFGVRRLLDRVTVAINEGEHIGVIGPNGAGKTTLFKILAGVETLDHGSLSQRKGLRIGYLVQHDSWITGETVENYLARGTTLPLWDTKSLGVGLGLTDEIYQKEISSLSGGYRMRCKLLHLLAEEPDVLLLDEPTNYLDLESVLVLEEFLQGYKNAFLLISHDREFLRRTTDHILEVEAGDIVKYPGSLDDYFEQKEMLRVQLEARAQSIEDKRKEVINFVARFGAKASKASQAQSRLKSLDRLEKIEIKALPAAARIEIPPPIRTGKTVVSVEDVTLGYGDRVVLSGLNFHLQRGEHLGIVGVNGAGKSTFLKALAGQLQPLSGTLKLGLDVSIGYYAQHVSEALDPKHTVLESLGVLAHRETTKQELLGIAGSLLFSDDDAQKKISVLSGGEKSRVALGQILLQRAPCLILDEPTNHLDFQTVEALTLALMDYEGTVITVSHDRSFIRRVGSKILEIRDGRADLYPGTYDEYIWSLQKGSLAARQKNEQQSPQRGSLNGSSLGKNSDSSMQAQQEQRKQWERDLRKIESDLKKADAHLAKTTAEMEVLNQKLFSHPNDPQTNQWLNEWAKLQTQVADAEKTWLELGEAKEKITNELSAGKKPN